MVLYAEPPKNMITWLTGVFSAEVNIMRELNGLSIEKAFGFLFSSEYFFEALRTETDGWNIPPYWGYVRICKEHGLEPKPALFGYPFPFKDRIRAITAYVLDQYWKRGIRPDFLYEKLRTSGIFRDYAIGLEPVNEKAKLYSLAAEACLASIPESSFE